KKDVNHKYTDEELDLIQTLASRGLNQSECLNYLGYYPTPEKGLDFYLSAAFNQRFMKGKSVGVFEVSNMLYENAVEKKNFLAQMFFLKSVAGWQSKEQQKQVNSTIVDKRRIQIIVPQTATPEQWTQLAEDYEKNKPSQIELKEQCVGETI